MTPQEENIRLQQQVNQELMAYNEAQRKATAETNKAAEAEAKIEGVTTSLMGAFQKLLDAQLKYQVAMAKGQKGASQFNDGIDAMTESTQMAAVALSLLVPGGMLVKGVVAGLTFLATNAMKAGAEMQKAANDQADALKKSYDSMSKIGATASDGMTGLFKDVNKMRLNVLQLDAMAGVMANSAKEMSAMGGTVYKARGEFANLVSGMGAYEKGMLNLGMSYDEQAEAAMGYMKIQSNLTQGQQKDYGKLAGGMKKYLEETEALTRVTGMSRKEQEAALEKHMAQQRFGAKVQQLMDEGKKEEAELLQSQMKKYAAKGEMFAQAFADMTTGMITSDAAMKGNMSSQGKMLEEANAITEGRIKNETEANASFQETMGTVKDVHKSANALFQAGVGEDMYLPFKEGAEITKAANQDFAKQIAEAGSEVGKLINSTDKVDKQLIRYNNMIKAQNDEMMGKQAALNDKFSSAMAGAGFMDKIMAKLQPLMDMLMTQVNKIIHVFEPLVTGLGEMLLGAISAVVKIMTGDIIGGLMDFKSGWDSAAAGLEETTKRYIDETISNIKTFGGNLLKSVEFITGPLGPVFENIGKVVSGFGDSIKTGISKFGDAMVDMVAKLWERLSALIPDLGAVKDAAGSAVGAVKGAASSAGNYLSSVFGGGSAAPAGKGGAAPAPAAAAATSAAGGGKPVPTGGGRSSQNDQMLAAQRDSGDMQRTANNAPPPAGQKGGSGSMDDAATKEMIARHEGIRMRPYKDSLGLWTVGVGHLIGDGKSLPDNWNREFSREEVMALFDKDYEHHKKAAESNTPNYSNMSGAMKSAFVDLAFNMGPTWMSKWPTLQKQLNSKDAAGAGDNLAGSKWATQVGNRAGEIVGMVRSGFAKDGGIFDGPKSGYPMTLHGNEAVIPLKDGAVPVTMSQEFNMTATNLGELVNIMKSNVGMQNQMLAVLEEIRRSQSTMTDNTGKMVAMAS